MRHLKISNRSVEKYNILNFKTYNSYIFFRDEWFLKIAKSKNIIKVDIRASISLQLFGYCSGAYFSLKHCS